jgi:hypothetical protein
MDVDKCWLEIQYNFYITKILKGEICSAALAAQG